MKAAFALLLLTSVAFAQNTSTAAAVAPGCGPANVHFDVRTDKHQHPIVQPEAGKAVVYFVQDDREFLSHPRPTTGFGIDGEWVGATQSNSYFYTPLSPGEHHLCASWQSFVAIGATEKMGAAHFTAEPGRTYFFQVRNFWTKESGLPARMELLPLDSDEGQLLASKFSFSISQPKK